MGLHPPTHRLTLSLQTVQELALRVEGYRPLAGWQTACHPKESIHMQVVLHCKQGVKFSGMQFELWCYVWAWLCGLSLHCCRASKQCKSDFGHMAGYHTHTYPHSTTQCMTDEICSVTMYYLTPLQRAYCKQSLLPVTMNSRWTSIVFYFCPWQTVGVKAVKVLLNNSLHLKGQRRNNYQW